MDVTTRTIDEQEFPAFVRTMERAFSAVATEQDIAEERRLAELDRCIAAFDGSTIVGTAAAFTMPMTVPGAEVSTGYVTGVGVSPTHRRRGVNTALMRHQLDDAHERGELVTVLHASEGGIYGRFGYGLSSFGLAIGLETTRSVFVRGHEPSGTLRILEQDAARAQVLAIHDRVRREVPGMVGLDDERLTYTLREHGPDKDLPYLCVLHEGQDGPDGYAIYRVRHDWRRSVPESTLAVRDLQAATPGANADLWRYLFDVDLIARVEARSRPVDEPLLYLLQEPRRLHGTIRDGLWARLVDVAAALEARRYAAAGRVVLEVADPFCPWNEGRYELEVGEDGSASCRPSTAEPDLACSASDLGASYLGAAFGRLQRAGLVIERTPGAAARADALFAWDRAPWCPYIF